MLKKIFFPIVFLLLFLVLSSKAHAAGEFASSYDVSYEVDTSGLTQVTEQITVKNLTDQYYASSFTLNIGATQISDVSASDSQGPLSVEVTQENTKTRITVNLSQQITGIGKQYPWTLKFKSKDFTEHIGRVWQVSVPKIVSTESLDNYNLTLSVPVSFDDPSSILPEPQASSEAGGRLIYSFTKEQLLESGILANFGTQQLFNFELTFQLENYGLLPAVVRIPLPPDTAYQQVLIESIDPRPETVTADIDGNFLAHFRLGRRSKQQVKVTGLAKLYLNKRFKASPLTKAEEERFTFEQKYWEKNTTQIRTKASELLKDHQKTSNQDKARIINQYVSNFLEYDRERLEKQDFNRLGALAVLTHPQQALCSEFTDLFITLARAADIPARMLVGYAFTSNRLLRPSSLSNSVLHAWPEYYDTGLGWVMTDPTWQNTTGGVDYFSKFDLNHFVLAIRGSSSSEPLVPDQVSVELSQADFKPRQDLQIALMADDEIFAGFPSQVKVVVNNNGSSSYPATQFSLSSSKIEVVGNTTFTTPLIPPFGRLEYKFDLRTNWLWQSFDDVLKLTTGDQSVDKKISVKPFLALKFFSQLVVIIITIMVAIYLLVLILHLKWKLPPSKTSR